METPDAVSCELSMADNRAMLKAVCRDPTSERVVWFVLGFVVSVGGVLFGRDGQVYSRG